MKQFFLVTLVTLLAGWCTTPALAGPTLCPPDLDEQIRALPLRQEADPVADLSRRLTQLEAVASRGTERPALRQALGIIQLARQIRLTSQIPSAEGPLLAGI